MSTSSEINIRIELDENRVPAKIEWQASEAGQSHPAESKSVFLSFLDRESLDTSTLFLWTKECQVAEMDRNIFYALTAMADGYFRATQNTVQIPKDQLPSLWFQDYIVGIQMIFHQKKRSSSTLEKMDL